MEAKKDGKALKGSQKWLQVLVNEKPELINAKIAKNLKLKKGVIIEWRSPLKKDKYVEYRDNKFLKTLKITEPTIPLNEFWPKRGPVWDGLAIADETKIIVEAKSHIDEIVSGSTKAGQKSRPMIEESLSKIKKFLNSKSEADWSKTFYQYTNRLAHLYFLRELNDYDAYLVFIYFINDKEMNGPESKEEWEGAIKLLHSYMGIGRHKLSKYVHDIFIDVNELK